MAFYKLDARGLCCPMPVLEVQTKVKELLQGDILEVICTDFSAKYDIPVWCKLHEHVLINMQQSENDITFTIQI